LVFLRALFIELIYARRANTTQHASTLSAYEISSFQSFWAHLRPSCRCHPARQHPQRV